MGKRKNRVVNNSEPKSQRVRMKKEYSQTRKNVQKIRKPRKHEEYAIMEQYIKTNYRKALNKLKRAMNKGYYSASDLMQEANSKLHMLYKKISNEENISFSSMYDASKYNAIMKDFREFGISRIDTSVLYQAIDDILSVDARKASRDFSNAMKKFESQNMDYLKQFRRLSKMSSDFHEIFAFLSYDAIALYMEQGLSDESIFEEYLKETQTKWLTYDDVQQERMTRLNSKLSSTLDADFLKYLQDAGYDI